MKKILLTSILSVVMCISLIAGATFALFTSESEVNIAVTSGKIDVKAVAEIDNDNTSFGLPQSSATVNGSNVIIDKIMPMDYVTVNVHVKNNSNVSAKYRAIIESLDSNALANELDITIGTEEFTGMAYTTWTDLEPETDGQTISIKIELPYEAEDGQGETCNYSVYVEAVQANAGVTDFNERANREENPEYTIYDKVDLYQFANSVNSGVNYTGKTVTLEEDVDLENTVWTPIGTDNTAITFIGTFDGNGKTVSNLFVKGENCVGLFGSVEYKSAGGSGVVSEVKNLTVDGFDISGNHYAGAIVGYAYANVINCKAINGNITICPNIVDGKYDNGDKAGGIIGWVGQNGIIDGNTVENVDIKAYRDLGGVLGHADIANTVTNNTAKNVTLAYDTSVVCPSDPNGNAGAIIGRIRKELTAESNNVATNVTVPAIISDSNEFTETLKPDDSNMDDESLRHISVIMSEDLTVDVTAWQNDAIGGNLTETVTIDGQGHTLTFNQTNNDWNNIVITNDATLIIKNAHITNTGKNDGPWNRHDINFACKVVLENVTSDKALAFKNDATLKNVTISDDRANDDYLIWIQANGQTVEIDELTIIDTKTSGTTRGIKIEEQYVDAPEKVTLVVKNASFDTSKKAAILVKSVAGADITLENIDISNVDADKVNAVWCDEASITYASLITVTGGTCINEP